MTADAAELRLDADLWTRTPLGTIGPHGLLGDIAASGQMSYRPLLAHHLLDGPLLNELDRAVTVVQSSDEMASVLERPDLAPFCPPADRTGENKSRWERDRSVAVVVHDRRGDGVNAIFRAGIDRHDRRVAHVQTCWVPNQAILRSAGVDELLGAGWLTLFKRLARKGAVGVTATEAFSGRDIVDVLRRVAGFRPAAEIYAALGLSPAEHVVILVQWRATVEDGQVVRFGTRPELDGPARDELMRRLRWYFELAAGAETPRDTDPQPYRMTIGGDIGIDGPQGWGNVMADDWYEPTPDVVPERTDPWDRRAEVALRAWLRADGPGEAPDG